MDVHGFYLTLDEKELAQRSPGAGHTRSSCSLFTKPGYKRYLVETAGGE